MRYPIFNHREVIGYASNLKGAVRCIERCIDVSPRARLRVWMRNTDLIDLPAGFVYSIVWGDR